MKSFSEMGITTSTQNIFNVSQIHIDEVLNQVLEIHDFHPDVTTKYGQRHVVLLKHEGKERKLFTDSKKIKEQLEKVEKSDFPFTAKISVLWYGDRKKTYLFT